MPKVSILMNCYNGEEYLVEAIDSVFNQTFNDWEILFIDNCSIDNSANIAKSYGEKIKYYKTEKNIPLGAARNFGLQYCSGEYVAFLDTDDIWLPSMLKEQLISIESGNYALSYTGQIEINEKGKIIGEIIPSLKNGKIFSQLLKQFDVPIVSSMIKKSILLDNDLNFDLNVSTSEEYCLFMQLSVNNEFVVIPKGLVKYRIHDKSLTNKTISKWASERRYTLNKIKQKYPKIEENYPNEFKEAYARASYYESQYLVSIGKKWEAFLLLSKYSFVNKKYLILSLLLLLPSFVWKKIQEIKYGRKV